MTEPQWDDATEMHLTMPKAEPAQLAETETDRTLVVAVQTRDQLRAAMTQLSECISVLQAEIRLKRQQRREL
jgi:hypothetical protein